MNANQNHTDQSADELFEAIRIMQRFKFQNRFCCLNESEHFFLRILYALTKASDTNSVYVSTITKELNVSGPAVSKMLRQLEEKDLIHRETDPADRRNTYVSLTEKGLQQKKAADSHISDFFGKVYERVGEEDMHTFRQLLIKFCNAMIDVSKTYANDNKESEIPRC